MGWSVGSGAVLVAVLAACVGGADHLERDTAVVDTGTFDIVEMETHVDAATEVAPETSIDSEAPSEVADGRPEVSETCAKNDDCQGEVPACHSWQCIGQLCQLAASAGACDDNDACTGQGTCVDGACQPGPELTCGGATECTRALCDPLVGCTTELVLGGYCETGRGKPRGLCEGLRMMPVDVCVEGGCADGETPVNAPLPKSAVVGSWFVVTQSANAQARGAMSGLMDFGFDGVLNGALLTRTTAISMIGDSARPWCLDENLGVAFDLGTNHFVGQVDPAGKTMAAIGTDANDLLVGVRPAGNVVDLDGTYAALLTGEDASGQIRIWSGPLAFSLGCLAEGAQLQSSAGGGPLFFSDNHTCLTLRVSGLTKLTLGLEDGGTVLPMVWEGVIGAAGDVLVFRRPNSGSVLTGMLVLVRLSDSGAAFTGNTGWVPAFQESRVLGTSWSYRSTLGALSFRQTALINGVFADHAVTGDAVHFDEYGRFVLALDTTHEQRTFSGYLAPTGGLGFFYEVVPPATWTSVIQVSETPAWSALGVVIQRTRL